METNVYINGQYYSFDEFKYFDEFISDDLLEKAWKMPWGWGKKEEFKPILVIFGENLDVLDGNSRIERDREAVEEFLELHKLYLKRRDL